MSTGVVITVGIFIVIISILVGKITELDETTKAIIKRINAIENKYDADIGILHGARWENQRQINDLSFRLSQCESNTKQEQYFQKKVFSQLTQLETKFAALYDRVAEQPDRPDKWT